MRALATHDTFTQFTSQGHVLGFRAGEFFLSNATYALRVQFIGANAVTPQTDGETLQCDVSNEFSHTTYANLWDGITLTYDKGGGSVTAPGTITLSPTTTTTYNLVATCTLHGNFSAESITVTVNP